jgi:hypothetical protein
VRKIAIRFGTLSEPILTQVIKQGMNINASDASCLQEDVDAVCRLYIRSILTESETKKVRQRILKRIVKCTARSDL